jgi:hypothetical protein
VRIQLERLLSNLGQKASDVRSTLTERDAFDLVAELTTDERDRLLATLSALGTTFALSDRFVSNEGKSWRLQLPLSVGLQLLAVGAIAVAAQRYGFSTLFWTAFPVAGVLALGVVRSVAHSVTISRTAVSEKLGPVNHALWGDALVMRRNLSQEPALAAAGACTLALCNLIEQVRDRGQHLLEPEFQKLDDDVHALLRRTFRLLTALDRVCVACSAADFSAPRQERLVTAKTQMVQALGTIASKLEALRLTLIERSGLAASQESLDPALASLAEVQAAIETGLKAGYDVDDALPSR